MPSCPRYLLLLGILLIAGLVPQPVHAQEASRYTFALRGTSMDEALRKLITTTRLDLSVNPTLIDGKRVYCVIEDAAAEDALRCLLKGTGLDYYRLSSGLYVLIETPEAPPQKGTLQGIIVDGATGEPLSYAHILLADGSAGAVSNESGRFLIANLNPGYYHVTTSYIGYRQRVDSVWVPPQGTGHARLPLHAEALPVTPIVVDGLQWRQPSKDLGTGWLDEYNLAQYPGGSPDVSQGLGTLSGIRLNDATADVHVQGGEAGEHQFRLDGAPVFVPISIGGLVGPFSPFAIGRVTVQKTGFGAEIGSQGSGVIQVDHNIGDARLFDVQADPLSINARLGLQLGTLNATQTTLMLAGRYGLWNVLGSPSFRNLLEDWNRPDPFMLAAFDSEGNQTGTFRRTLSDGNPGIGFYDLHAAARVRFGPLRSLYASTYLGHRELDSERNIFEAFAQAAADPTTAPPTRDLYGWTNSTSQARFEAVLGSRVLASLRGRASLFRLGHDYVVSNPGENNNNLEPSLRLSPLADNDNRIQEFAVEARFDVAATDFWTLETGFEPTHTFSRFLVQGTQPVPISHRSSLWKVGSFLTNRVTVSRRLSAEVGTRLTYVDARQAFYAEPRLSVRYDQPGGLLGPWSARVATGLYRQFVNQFDVSSRSARALLATSRTWLAVDESVRPPLSTHLAGEMLFQPGSGWTLRLEGYYKKHTHLLAVNYSATRSDVSEEEVQVRLPSLNQSRFLASGEGYTYGSAVELEKRWHRLGTEIRYERSEAQRTFGLFFTGNSVPAPWNEPHRLEWAFDWQPTRSLTLLGRWRGIWGRTWGFRQSYYDYLGAYPIYIPERAPTRLLFGDEATEIQVDIAPQLREFGLNHPEQHHLPPVYQLDLSVAYTQEFGGLMLQTRLDLLNVLDRDNVADWRFTYNPETFEETGLLEREDRLLLPFTPSLAVRMAW
ncbi:MAG TPA: carboxypeptidase regulatory-like domain-containing protein [Rhodothermales bacterium]|nr:carboxypeptidase regulatory-like domain-containing protein [Rhodothermales bacterium]